MYLLYAEDDLREYELLKKTFSEVAPEIIVEQVTSLDETVTKIDEGIKTEKQYDIVLIGINLYREIGSSIIAYVRSKNVNIPCLVLVDSLLDTDISAVLKSGIFDYVSRNEKYVPELPKIFLNSINRYKNENISSATQMRILFFSSGNKELDNIKNHFNNETEKFIVHYVHSTEELYKTFNPLEKGNNKPKWNALVIDYCPTQMNLFETLKELCPKTKCEIPVILLLDEDMEEIGLQSLRFGVKDYVLKNQKLLHRLLIVLDGLSFYVNERRKAVSQNFLLAQTLKYVKDAVSVTNLEDEIIFVNDAFIELYGYSEEELLGNHISMVRSSTVTQQISDEIYNTTKQSGWHGEILNKRKDGSEFPVEIWTSVVMDEQGTHIATVGVARDVTERYEAENRIVEAEKRYRTLFEESPFGVAIFGKELMVPVQCNDQVLEILEMSSEVFFTTNFSGLFVRNYRGLYTDSFKKTIESGSDNFEMNYTSFVGNKKELRISSKIISLNNQEFIMVNFEDITQKKLQQNRLLGYQKLMRGVSEAMQYLVREENLHEAITGMLTVIGNAAGADRSYLFENSLHPDTGALCTSQKFEWVRESIPSAIDKGGTIRINYNRIPTIYEKLKNGKVFNELVKNLSLSERNILTGQGIKSLIVVPIYVNNKFWGFIGFDNCHSEEVYPETDASILIASAVTLARAIERENTKQELIHATREAQKADKLKSSFLANMSHELRTPLTGILGFSEILLTEDLGEENHKFVEMINSSGKRLIETVNSILDLTKIEANQLELNLNKVSLNLITEKVVESYKTAASEKGLELSAVHLKSNVDTYLDEKLTIQILGNLINNAVKYTAKGFVKVEVDEVIIDKQVFAKIDVIDSGIGISIENLQTIFEPFRQASEGFNRNFEGTGLGLTITAKLVELLNGKISVKSTPQQGSVFTLVFPAYEKESSPTGNDDTKNSAITEVLQNGNEKLLPKVLIVEDDYISAEAMKRFLKNRFVSSIAYNDSQALELVQNELFDIVLMDISLKQSMNGIEVMNEIKKIPAYEKIPFVAVTAYAMAKDKEHFLSTGFDSYLPKPFSKDQLVVKLDQVMGQFNK